MHTCSDEVRDYLDENMPGWRDRFYAHRGRSSVLQMEKARAVVKRFEERGRMLPRRLILSLEWLIIVIVILTN